jgi:hypothetical protein
VDLAHLAIILTVITSVVNLATAIMNYRAKRKETRSGVTRSGNRNKSRKKNRK